jgi:hypothetical protein
LLICLDLHGAQSFDGGGIAELSGRIKAPTVRPDAALERAGMVIGGRDRVHDERGIHVERVTRVGHQRT